MGKKRRSTTTRAAAPSEPTLNAKDARIAAVDSWKDVADEEDAFHLERDKVLLSNPLLQPRQVDEEDDEQEVMGLEEYGYRSSSDEEEEEEEEDVMEQDGAARGADDDSEEEAEPEEGEEGWGTSKKDYYGHDDEDAVDPLEEEAEAKRIQAKQLAAMDAADFGFDEDAWAAPAPAAVDSDSIATHGTVVIEKLPTTLPDDPAERAKLLNARHPEFAPLTAEFFALQEVFPALEMSARAAETVGETPATSAVIRKWRVASAYLGVLSMYFAVLTKAEEVEEVREHPVMTALLGVRQAWEKVKGERVERIEARMVEKKRKRSDMAMSVLSEESDGDASDSDASDAPASPPAAATKKQKTSASETQDFSDLASLSSLTTSRRAARARAATTTTAPAGDTGDFTEEHTLNALDAADKAVRRKNLRFYSSQIVSASSRRAAAGHAAGGDLDIPHRERRKERELRLRAETQRRRDRGEGADLSDGEPDAPKPAKKAPKLAVDAGNEFTALLTGTAAKDAKAAKAAKYAAEKEAARVGGLVVPEMSADGKRAIGWTIEKNKGLTPHRKKEVRNPRVKKRNAYEKRKKQLGSVKQVYKGGLKGSYGGEKTGIKTGLVKSVKFKE
ncbi:Sas10 C-terminal domain-containing protein [Geopyxis carbonaria]|nr:Sas10 C-terminal domain-containing protein [Geopyxis carbonaria]